jgi:hypothetical protein
MADLDFPFEWIYWRAPAVGASFGKPSELFLGDSATFDEYWPDAEPDFRAVAGLDGSKVSDKCQSGG